MTTKEIPGKTAALEELWEQRQPVDHKGRKIIVSHQGPNRAERRRAGKKQRLEQRQAEVEQCDRQQQRKHTDKRRKTRRKR